MSFLLDANLCMASRGRNSDAPTSSNMTLEVGVGWYQIVCVVFLDTETGWARLVVATGKPLQTKIGRSHFMLTFFTQCLTMPALLQALPSFVYGAKRLF